MYISHSIPFHSIPFHSLLFSSLLFSSILFYSILLTCALQELVGEVQPSLRPPGAHLPPGPFAPASGADPGELPEPRLVRQRGPLLPEPRCEREPLKSSQNRCFLGRKRCETALFVGVWGVFRTPRKPPMGPGPLIDAPESYRLMCRSEAWLSRKLGTWSFGAFAGQFGASSEREGVGSCCCVMLRCAGHSWRHRGRPPLTTRLKLLMMLMIKPVSSGLGNRLSRQTEA